MSDWMTNSIDRFEIETQPRSIMLVACPKWMFGWWLTWGLFFERDDTIQTMKRIIVERMYLVFIRLSNIVQEKLKTNQWWASRTYKIRNEIQKVFYCSMMEEWLLICELCSYCRPFVAELGTLLNAYISIYIRLLKKD